MRNHIVSGLGFAAFALAAYADGTIFVSGFSAGLAFAIFLDALGKITNSPHP